MSRSTKLTLSSFSHSGPPKPGRHWHTGLLPWSTQLAPFWHSVPSQGLLGAGGISQSCPLRGKDTGQRGWGQMKPREEISPTVLVRNSLTTPRKWTLKVHLKGHPEDVLCECCFPRELSSTGDTWSSSCNIIWPFPEKEPPSSHFLTGLR